MKFEGTGLDQQTAELSRLDFLMEQHGLVRAGQWDYERVTYDKKMEQLGEIYYFRIQGYITEGEVGGRHAVVKLLTPLLGKHYYPHGVEYGEGEDFPEPIVQSCENTIKRLKKDLEAITL
ncbi:YugN family protein [Metabacillus sp. FJAT-52054]|uniref:YugN family protein n=1 Tax=Metabacillus sediminis TaxID=3117746 RepID=A0ABZ2NN01_9BACI